MALSISLNKCIGDAVWKGWPTLVQQVRFRNRPNFKRPLPMHYQRKKMFVVCEPVLPPKPQICENVLAPSTRKSPLELIEDNPYAVFLAGQMRRDFGSHPMIAVFHYNHYTQYDFQNIRGMLFDAKFPMKIQQQVNTSVMQYALGGTRWAPVLPLCVSKVALGFCSDTNVPKLLKLLKKMPQFLLLGLVYDNRLLHKDDVERVAKMTSLLGTQSQLSSTLNLPGMTLSQNLTAGQIALSHSLSSLTKDLAQNESSSSDSSDSSSSSKDSD